ncbi:MAG: hypothetical protein U0R66_05460 [Mycobacterium sp.]
MSAAFFVGRVGGMAVALGIGVAVVHGTAVAAADSSARDSGSAGRSSTAQDSRHSARAATASSAPARPSGAASVRAAAVPVTHPAAAPPNLKIPSAATTSAPAPTAAAPTPGAPDPQATTSTSYGDLGKWMINKNGQVADWVNLPYCTGGTCKTLQEPINTIFTVKASSKNMAEAQLNFALRRAGFPPSCCSSVGYSAIVDQVTSKQMPRGGPLGVGVLGRGVIQNGLLGALAGIGPAYRDASFLLANSHLRTFGGESDGNGNYIFTASVSKEYLTKDPATGKTTHGYDSFDQARTKLLNAMVAKGATNMGMVAMDNKIPADDPNYSTGDHDGMAQVIALSGMAALAWRAQNPS